MYIMSLNSVFVDDGFFVAADAGCGCVPSCSVVDVVLQLNTN